MRVGNWISYWKYSAEFTRNGFRYSTEESAHSEAFRGLQKSQFRGSEPEKTGCFCLRHALERNSESLLLFFPRNGIPSIFLLCGMVRNGFPRVFRSAEWFRTEFREFASIFVLWYRILSIFLLCGTVQNGIPRVFCSEEKPEFRRNEPVYSVFHGIIFLSEMANPMRNALRGCAVHL